MPRRPLVLLAFAACALSLGGWVVGGPLVASRTPAPAEPPVDLSLPADRAPAGEPGMRDVREGAAPIAAAADDAARCGDDQMAVYAEPQPDPVDGAIHVESPVPDPDGVVRRYPGETRPAGVGYTGAMGRIDAALRASGDAFDRSVADWLDLNRIAPPAQRTEALVQAAVVTTDPRVYGLAHAACNAGFVNEGGGAAPACARLSTAEWARLDPGNGLPWLWALQDADRRGDGPAQREALQRLAGSARFDLRTHAGAAAVARLRLADADLAAQTMASMQAMGGISVPPFQALARRCRDGAGGDADLAAACARVAALLYERSDSPIGQGIGAAIHQQLTGDERWRQQARENVRRLGAAWADQPVSRAPCGNQRQLLARFVRLGDVGELAFGAELLRAASAP